MQRLRLVGSRLEERLVFLSGERLVLLFIVQAVAGDLDPLEASEDAYADVWECGSRAPEGSPVRVA